MIFYIALFLAFLFLSHLSGLPQAMFYHLHIAVALPLAFMGFLILIPGFLREVFVVLLWPQFKLVMRRALRGITPAVLTKDTEENLEVKSLSSSSSSSLSGLDSDLQYDNPPRLERRPPSWSKMLIMSESELEVYTREQLEEHKARVEERQKWRNSRRKSRKSHAFGNLNFSHIQKFGHKTESVLALDYISEPGSSCEAAAAEAAAEAVAAALAVAAGGPAAAAEASPPPEETIAKNKPRIEETGAKTETKTETKEPETTMISTTTTTTTIATNSETKEPETTTTTTTPETATATATGAATSATPESVAKKNQELRLQKMREQFESAIRTLTPILRRHLSKNMESPDTNEADAAAARTKTKVDI